MKKILCLLASFVFVSCGVSADLQTQKLSSSGSHIQEFLILSELEGPLRQETVDKVIQRNSKTQHLEKPYTSSDEVVGPRMIVTKWTDGTHLITLNKTSQTQYELRIDGNSVLENKLCFGAVDGPILGVDNMNNMPLIKVRHSCSEESINGKEDIYYDGKLLSQELGVDQVYEAFIIHNQTGFIVQNNNKEYVLFNGQVSSPLYDAITVRACCMNPHYFGVEEDGVTFLAREEGKRKLVNIKLL